MRQLKRLAAIIAGREKQYAEALYWQKEVDKYVKWFHGEALYGNRPPTEAEKIDFYDERTNALLTFYYVHQAVKYLHHLDLTKGDFEGLSVLDVGSGPFPNALCFERASCVYSLDPLIPRYIEAGYPIHAYNNKNKFIAAPAEKIPVPDGTFSAVVSVNAIDHVDNFAQTAREIKRVLKTDGRFRMHVHYHKPTLAEPHQLNDILFYNHYYWVKDLKIWRSWEEGDTIHKIWGN